MLEINEIQFSKIISLSLSAIIDFVVVVIVVVVFCMMSLITSVLTYVCLPLIKQVFMALQHLYRAVNHRKVAKH